MHGHCSDVVGEGSRRCGSRRATEGERWCDGQRKGGERLGERAVASEANISEEKHCVFVADVPTDVYKHAGFYKNASADTSEDVGRHYYLLADVHIGSLKESNSTILSFKKIHNVCQ